MEFSKPFKVVLNVNAHFFLCNVKIRQNLTSYKRQSPVSPILGYEKRRFSCIQTASDVRVLPELSLECCTHKHRRALPGGPFKDHEFPPP